MSSMFMLRTFPPLKPTVGSDGQPLITPSASIPRTAWPAGTACPVRFFIADAPLVLIRTEIADVVAGLHHHAKRVGLVVQLGEKRHQLEQLVRLHQQVIVVYRVSHGNGELKLPSSGTAPRDLV